MRRTSRSPRPVAGLALGVCFVITGCAAQGETSPTSPAASAPASSSATPADAHGIPDGVYERVAETPLSIDGDQLGQLTLKIVGDRFTQFETKDAGPEVGDLGTWSLDDRGHLVTLSESSGCTGCSLVFDWSLDDKTLQLKLVGGSDVDDGDRTVYDGSWVRSG
jgi:hypothetical protein